MTWDVVAGLVIGAGLGLVSALAIETRRDGRDAKRAARIIQAELLEINLTAHSLPNSDPYPYPMKDSDWLSQRDRLAVARLSPEDWAALSAFYVMNSLVAAGGVAPGTCEQVVSESDDVIKILGRFLRRGWWNRLRSAVSRKLRPTRQA